MATDKAKTMTRVTVIGAVFDALLGVAKLVVGWLSQSHALIADGIHSLSDLGTDVLVVLAARWSQEGPDANHPYGHERIETLATLGLGGALLVVAGGILLDSVQRVFSADASVVAGTAAFVVTLASIVIKEGLFRYTLHYAKELDSKLLEANAWHSRTDSLSSIAVLVGLIGVSFGYVWLDALAALVVAALIAKVALELLWDAMAELIDTALPEDTVAAMQEAAMGVPGLRAVHHIRTRTMGGKTMLDMHLQVDPRVSVSEGHEVGCWVAATLRAKFPEIADITFHVDPEDDADMDQEAPTQLRPLRIEVEERLRADWTGVCDVQGMQLHYLKGRIDVDVITSTRVSAATLCEKAPHPWLGAVRVFHPGT